MVSSLRATEPVFCARCTAPSLAKLPAYCTRTLRSTDEESVARSRWILRQSPLAGVSLALVNRMVSGAPGPVFPSAISAPGMLNVATVTAACEPMVAPVDGLFYRGKVLFGFPPGSIRGQHLRARPQVSATHSRGEDYCVIVHGRAQEIDLDARKHADVLDYFKEVYGASWDYWHEERYRDRNGSEFNGWVEARRMYTLKPHAAAEH